MISLIEGVLYEDDINGTRSYKWIQENLIEYVIRRDDDDFLKTYDRLGLPGLYILVGYNVGDDIPLKIYVGQTNDIRRRIRQHRKKKLFWEFVIVFQKSDGTMSSYEIEYLEHLMIKNLLEYGHVQLLENSQIPKVYLDSENKESVEKIFARIKDMLSYSRFDFFDTPKQIELKDFSVAEPGVEYGRQIRNSLSRVKEKNSFINEYGYDIVRGRTVPYDYFESDYCDEDESSQTFEIKGDGYSATIISLKDGKFMLLPFGTIKRRFVDKCEMDKFSQDWWKAIDINSFSIVKDIVTENFEDLKKFIKNETR